MEFKDNNERANYINKVLNRDITPVLDKLAQDTGIVFAVIEEMAADAIISMGYICYRGLMHGQKVISRRYKLAGIELPPLYRQIPEDHDNKAKRRKGKK